MSDDLKKELGEMLGVKSEDEAEEETTEEEVVEEEVETEVKEEEIEEVEETEVEEEDKEEPSEEKPEEEPEEEVEEDELTIANRRIAELEALQPEVEEEEDELAIAKKRIAELEAKPEEEEEIEITEELEEVDFMGDLDMEEVTSDSRVLNKLLNKVYGVGVDQGKSLRENVLLAIPNVIKASVAQQTTLKSVSDAFYNDNPDLDTPARKRIVGMVTEKINAEHPEYDMEKLLKEAEKDVRVTLNLKKKATTRNKEESPSFSKKTKGKSKPKTKPKLTELQQDLDDMSSVVT